VNEMSELINTKPELNINYNDLPPGSYIIKDGKLLPNLNDSAMKERNEKRETKEVEKESSHVSRLSSIDKKEIKKD
jgi:hypothetical protein